MHQESRTGVKVEGRTKNRRPILATVAELAGVSVPTVSKVINGRVDVAPDTRARIEAALVELGYESPMKRRARAAMPPAVELVFGGMNEGYSLELLKGMLQEAAGEGVELVLSSMAPANLREADHEEWARRMVESGRAGLILVTSEMTVEQLALFRAWNIPVVIIDPYNPPDSGFASVGATNWAGGKGAVEHLIGLGHRKIAHIGGPVAAECSVARQHGYLAALMGHGIEVRSEYMAMGAFSNSFGSQWARTMLDLDDPPTAIFTGNDSIAIGVLGEAQRRGIRVPEELSVVGFDGTALGGQVLPRLTSVAQPLQEMGRAALRSVLRMSRGEGLESPRMELATTLVVRDSTAPPPA